MLKTRKRWISLLVTLAMLVTFAVPFVGPASAATDNHVSTVPTVADDATNVSLGTITLKEDSDFADDLVGGRTFTVTFPAGVKIKNTVNNFVYWSNDGGAYVALGADNVNISGDYTVDVTIPAGVNSKVDAIQLRPIVDIDGFEGGDIKLTIESFDSGVTGGEFVVGRVGTGNTTASVIKVETIGESGKGGTIRITESSVGAIGDGSQVMTLKLPVNFKWDTTNFTSAKVSFLAGLSGSSITDFDLDGRTAKITFDPVDSRTQRGIIQIEPWIIAESDADYGDVEVNISGDKIDDADLVIANYSDFGVTIEADDTPEEVLSGQYDSELTKINIKENVDGSLISNRNTKVTFPSWVKITDVDVTDTKNISGTASAFETAIKAGIDGTSNEVEFKAPDAAGKTEFSLTFTVSVKANQGGDIVAKFSGRGGIEGEVTVGKALVPVSATATAKDIKIGVKNQPISDIVITEAKKGAIAAGTLIVSLPDGVEWSADPKVTVTEGNLDIDTDSVDTTDNVLSFTVDNESTKVSTITISGCFVDLDRTIAEGPVKASIKGDAIVANSKAGTGWLFGSADPGSDGSATAVDEGEFDQSSAASVTVANVVTPAPGEKTGTAVFKIGDAKYTLNGAEVTMDAAPYIKDGRTMVPVRFAANAVGVADSNIIWDAASKKVTVIKGDRVIQMTIGSNVMLINGAAITMDTAPEISNDRTMLPVRFLGQALGAEFVWDAAAQTVTVNF